jgi:DnaK suppressor protein
MPQSLDRPSLEQIRIGLTNRRAELIRDRSSLAELTVPQLPDPVDELAAASARDVALDSVNRRGLLLAQVEQALRRLANGEYGFCVECRAPVALNRLEALPWAALCLPCQEIADAKKPPATGPSNFEDAA